MGCLLAHLKPYHFLSFFSTFFILVYFRRPFIFAINTFIICSMSSIISSFSFLVSSFIISISPFDYSFIILSIKSYPNLHNRSLYDTTTLFTFPRIAKSIILFSPFRLKLIPDPISFIIIYSGY